MVWPFFRVGIARQRAIHFTSHIRDSLMRHFAALRGPTPRREFSLTDISFILFFLFFGFFSRTFRIAYPPARVFDECHFGGFTNNYMERTYFHDIHPPLGKLLFAGVGWLTGYSGHLNFSGDTPYNDKHYVDLRMTPASFSAMMPSLGFLAMRVFGFTFGASALAAVLLGIEPMLIVEGRLVLIDGFLHAFTVCTVCTLAFVCANPHSALALIFCGIAAGCTFSVKYTGASVTIFVVAFFVIRESKSRLARLFHFGGGFRSIPELPLVLIIVKSAVVGIAAVSVMFLTFAIHLVVLDFHGDGEGFMPPEFHWTLVPRGATDFGPRTRGMPFHKRIIELMKAMHRSNMGITAPHGASSKWWQWPLVLMQSIVYFSNRFSLVLHPSPFVWYPAALGPCLATALSVIGYFLGNTDLTALAIWPVGYFASWLPFALIPRVIFVYHYLVPLIFGIFAFAASLELLLSRVPVVRTCFFVIWCAISLTSWVFFAPWCYAMEGYDWDIRAWYPWIFEPLKKSKP
jgi:dolichyl-phosphate-mannose--protein O-mannosyl transferase